MARPEGRLKKLDIRLDESLYKSWEEAMAHRGFSLKVRLAVKRLIDSFGNSPEGVTERVRRRLTELAKETRKPLIKRLTIEFQVEDIYKVDQANEYFRGQGINLSRQDIIKFALLEWPNPQ
ncbi:hypothetical protein ES708_29227 [subsurface metagenome]